VTTIAFLQARMSSTRLPGKVLADVAGSPMIVQQLARIGRARSVDQTIVVTSTEASDEVLVDELERRGITVFRGSLNDVLQRYREAIAHYPCEIALRLTADCPLIDPLVIDATVHSHQLAGADYTSNTLIRKFPRGLDCEVFQPEVLDRLAQFELQIAEHEHVTMGIYNRPNTFRLNAFANSVDESNRRWTVDTPEDLEFVRMIYRQLFNENPNFGSDDIRMFLALHPEKEHWETDDH
jgi:spore coat polysaccharide biosynthesis protein SpsF